MVVTFRRLVITGARTPTVLGRGMNYNEGRFALLVWGWIIRGWSSVLLFSSAFGHLDVVFFEHPQQRQQPHIKLELPRPTPLSSLQCRKTAFSVEAPPTAVCGHLQGVSQSNTEMAHGGRCSVDTAYDAIGYLRHVLSTMTN